MGHSHLTLYTHITSMQVRGCDIIHVSAILWLRSFDLECLEQCHLKKGRENGEATEVTICLYNLQ